MVTTLSPLPRRLPRSLLRHIFWMANAVVDRDSLLVAHPAKFLAATRHSKGRAAETSRKRAWLYMARMQGVREVYIAVLAAWITPRGPATLLTPLLRMAWRHAASAADMSAKLRQWMVAAERRRFLHDVVTAFGTGMLPRATSDDLELHALLVLPLNFPSSMDPIPLTSLAPDTLWQLGARSGLVWTNQSWCRRVIEAIANHQRFGVWSNRWMDVAWEGPPAWGVGQGEAALWMWGHLHRYSCNEEAVNAIWARHRDVAVPVMRRAVTDIPFSFMFTMIHAPPALIRDILSENPELAACVSKAHLAPTQPSDDVATF
jgi:hypothetical protein